MTRFDFDPRLVFYELRECGFIERCGKDALYPYKHPTAPEWKKIFAKDLCASCYFFLQRMSGKTICGMAACDRFIVPQRTPGIPSRFTTRARGLCNPCWSGAQAEGILDQYHVGDSCHRIHQATKAKKIEQISDLLHSGCETPLIASETGLSCTMVKRLIRENSLSKGSSGYRAA